MKKTLLTTVLLQSAFLYSAPGLALGPQSFLGINYSNSAALSFIKQGEIMIGGLEVYPSNRFTGTYNGVRSSASSNTSAFIPYGRLAYRMSPTIVVGLDITQPALTTFSYPSNSFINSGALNSYVRDTDFSPRVSWQATKQLALGLGLNINNVYNGEVSFAVPGIGNLYNKGDSWAYGFNAGLLYTFRPTTFGGLFYYSRITQNISGTSTLGVVSTNNFHSKYLLPETLNAEIVHFVSPKWLFDAVVRYSVWTPYRFVVLQNTAIGNVTIPLHYNNTFSYSLATKYDFTEKWAGLAKIEYDPTMQSSAYNSPALVTANSWLGGIGAQYMISKGLAAKLIYGVVTASAPSNIMAAQGPLVGTNKFTGRGVDFSITYDA